MSVERGTQRILGEPDYDALFTLEQDSAVEARGMLTLAEAPSVQKRTDSRVQMWAP